MCLTDSHNLDLRVNMITWEYANFNVDVNKPDSYLKHLLPLLIKLTWRRAIKLQERPRKNRFNTGSSV